MQFQRSPTSSSSANSNAVPASPRLGDSFSSLIDTDTAFDADQLRCFSEAAGKQLLWSVQKKQSIAKNRVRFLTNKLGAVSHRVASGSTPVVTLTDGEIAASWWSPSEMEAIQLQARSVVEHYMQHEPEYCQAVSILVATCARRNSQVLVGSNSSSAIFTSPEHDQVRGLTYFLTPTLARRMEGSLAAVWQAQTVLQRSQSGLLAARYQHASFYAAVWARVLANQDAASVHLQNTTDNTIAQS